MEQSDLDVLQTVPLYHLQTVARVRRLPQVIQILNAEMTANSAAPLSASSVIGIAPYLYDAHALSDLLTGLSTDETLLLREIVSCGGRANSRDLALYFERCIGQTPAMDEESAADVLHENGSSEQGDTFTPGQAQDLLTFARYPTAHAHGSFELALHQLLLFGLLYWGKQTHFTGRDYTSGVHDGVLIVPSSVAHAVRRVWPLIPPGEPHSQSVLQIVAPAEAIQNFQRLLYLYWSYVAAARDGLALVNNGFLARTALRQLCEHFPIEMNAEQMRLESDVPRFLFIRLLLQQLGLLAVQKNQLIARPAEDFFKLPVLERARRCYQAYVDAPFWNEILRLPDVNVRPVPDPLTPAHQEVIHARHQIVERLLAEVAEDENEDEPIDLLTFTARTRLHVPSLLFPRQYGPRTERYSQECNPYGYDFRLRRGWLTHREGWHMVEGGFIRVMITEPLYWMGLVLVGHSHVQVTFRLPSEACAIMSDQPVECEIPEQGRLLVQPNFELIALAPVSEGALLMLDSFADRVRLEHVAQYRLTKASVVRAIEHGLLSESILHYLEQIAGAEIPQNVRYSLIEWERQVRRVELWSAFTMIEVEDAALLDELLVAEETRHLFQRRLTLTMAEISLQHLSAVQELLWQRALLPALSSAPNQDVLDIAARIPEVQDSVVSPVALEYTFPVHDPQWRLHASGLLEPVYAVLDLYVVAALARFSTIETQSGWPRVTEATVQQALQQGLTLDAILRFLQYYCLDGIPGSLLIRLKLWGGGYDSASTQTIGVERAPLLRLSNEILHDLQSDEELSPLLGEEIADHQRLVCISEQDLTRVLQLLQERGFLTE
jgi:hypothetical protein